MRSVVLGASAGLGRALAEELARCGHELFLLSSDQRDVDPLIADLRLRFGARVSGMAADLCSPDVEGLHRICLEALGGVDCLFYVAGLSLMEQDPDRLSDDEARRLMEVNFASGVRIINAFVRDLSRPGANLIGIGSIAQARPRSRNTVYAASKCGLEFYFSGLGQQLSAKGCHVQYYRVGYVDTQMTFGQQPFLPKASPRDLAIDIRRGLGRNIDRAYLPRWWAPITAIYRMIPGPVFRRLGARGKKDT